MPSAGTNGTTTTPSCKSHKRRCVETRQQYSVLRLLQRCFGREPCHPASHPCRRSNLGQDTPTRKKNKHKYRTYNTPAVRAIAGWQGDGYTTRNPTTKNETTRNVHTCERKHKRPGPVPGVGVVPLLTPVHVDAEPGRGDRRAPQLLLAELGERLEQLLESLGAEVVFGRCSHLHAREKSREASATGKPTIIGGGGHFVLGKKMPASSTPPAATGTCYLGDR